VLLIQELGEPRRLDEMVATGAEQKLSLAAMAGGPEFLVHIAAGNIPNPTLMNIVLGLLTRSAQFVKCATGGALLPRLFAHSIYDADTKLGACLEIAGWRGGNADLENALFAEADCVTATGGDETLDEIRKRLPLKTRFLGYGHRVSFGFLAHEVLYGSRAKKNRRSGGGRCDCMESTRLFVAARDLRSVRRRNFSGTFCAITGGRIGAARTDRAVWRIAGGIRGGDSVASRHLRGARGTFAGKHAALVQQRFDGLDGGL
jgi:hypothetical protein